MKKITLLLLLASLTACTFPSKITTVNTSAENESEEISEEKINSTLENWHAAAANANFEDYFALMANDGVFIGTDATENWQNTAFREFSKPYFDKGKAWSFTTLERNIYTSENGQTAWFDELLDTQMGICRGSGVLEKVNKDWKIKHYVLSIAIPNEIVSEITATKKQTDSILILQLQKQY
ncbi:nuclear transport factor 2 family protein [Gillisia sp. Q332]|uniref:nuclear transport factor 2 family protein n=1 Tax=Gillisia xinjiangensis TaxID=3384765 RepID=UPI00391877D9